MSDVDDVKRRAFFTLNQMLKQVDTLATRDKKIACASSIFAFIASEGRFMLADVKLYSTVQAKLREFYTDNDWHAAANYWHVLFPGVPFEPEIERAQA